MIVTIFESTATSFVTNGLGSLPDIISGVVHEVLNGAFEFTMTYPTDGMRANEIRVDRLIAIKDTGNIELNGQAFRIYQIKRSMDNKRLSVYAHHVSYDLSGYPVSPFTLTGTASEILSAINSNRMVSSSFVLATNITSSSTMTVSQPKSMRACLGGDEGSFLQIFKCEFLFNNLLVRCLSRRGADNGVYIRYGKNLASYLNVRTTESAYSGSVAYWAKDSTCVVGSVQSVTPTQIPADRICIVDASSKFSSQPSTAQLNSYAQTYNTDNNIGQTYLETITVDFVPLWKTAEYKDLAPLETLVLGDTVYVVYNGTTYTARLVEYEYDILRERYTKTVLGAKKSTFAQTIRQVVKG